jgi:LAO/AO transport system kinase
MPRVSLSIEQLKTGILNKEISLLSKAITLIESSKKSDRIKASELVSELMPHAEKSTRIGITGSPGVGKSTFINSFVTFLTSLGHKVAVLAIDPSSNISGGSILGDKTRMQALIGNRNVYVRPTPSGGELGGVSAATFETILLCEAAGYDIILIETVGVGQSESSVYNLSDMLLFLTIAGAGDELQGIKRGIMELIDCIIVNKSDLIEQKALNQLMANLIMATQFFIQEPGKSNIKVLPCSSLNDIGMQSIHDFILEFMANAKKTGRFYFNRENQKSNWFERSIEAITKKVILDNPEVNSRIKNIKSQIKEGKLGMAAGQIQLIDYLESIIKP